MDYDAGRCFALVMETIELAGTENLDFRQAYPSLVAMEKAYKRSVQHPRPL